VVPSTSGHEPKADGGTWTQSLRFSLSPASELSVSIFGKIKSAIFGERGVLGSGHFGTPKPDAPATAPAPRLDTAPASSVSAPSAAPAPAAAPGQHSPAAESVDVEAVLQAMAARKGMSLNWRTSIVDLMKLLDLDSSLANRQELAGELGYHGSKDGSAEMNIWLHKAVMRELEKSGGRVPAALKD
jgi:hypothetical protein